MLAKVKRLFTARTPPAGKRPARSFAEKYAHASALLAEKGYGQAGGALLGYYPHVKQNPFQQMLYSASFEKGFACFDAHSPAEFTDIDTPIPMVAHYHWLFRVMRDAKNAKDAAHKAGVFLEHVHAQKRAGRTILWTVHNIISHGSKYPDEEASLRGEMAKLADHIHIMNADTVTLCMPYYDIPTEKCFYVPHPSYKGVYGDYVSKEDARQGFGLKREDKVFLLFGHMMPQKGGVRFLSQLDALQNALDGKSRILIAGQSGDADYMAQVMDLIGGRDDVQLHAGRVDDQHIQRFFKAADVVVCPYAVTLNSGVVMTAATFGRPVVVPHSLEAITAEIAGQSVSYNIDNIEDCVRACTQAVHISEIADTETVLRNWATKLSPAKVSAQFFEALRERL